MSHGIAEDGEEVTINCFLSCVERRKSVLGSIGNQTRPLKVAVHQEYFSWVVITEEVAMWWMNWAVREGDDGASMVVFYCHVLVIERLTRSVLGTGRRCRGGCN